MLQRIIGLGLQVTHLHLLAPRSAPSDECAQEDEKELQDALHGGT